MLGDIERSMQDGLSALTQANNLLEEALHGVDAATATEAQVCQFLKNSADAYQRAEVHYTQCQEQTDAALAQCNDVDWSALSASPQHCADHVAEIRTQLSTMPEDIARFCGAAE